MTTDPNLGRLCDVCGIRPMIGVASTSQPFSCAYCIECAREGADPEWIFEYLLQDVANGDPAQIREGLVTWSAGRFMTFHEWAAQRAGSAP